MIVILLSKQNCRLWKLIPCKPDQLINFVVASGLWKLIPCNVSCVFFKLRQLQLASLTGHFKFFFLESWRYCHLKIGEVILEHLQQRFFNQNSPIKIKEKKCKRQRVKRGSKNSFFRTTSKHFSSTCHSTNILMIFFFKYQI